MARLKTENQNNSVSHQAHSSEELSSYISERNFFLKSLSHAALFIIIKHHAKKGSLEFIMWTLSLQFIYLNHNILALFPFFSAP